jgi:hypothetical protein
VREGGSAWRRMGGAQRGMPTAARRNGAALPGLGVARDDRGGEAEWGGQTAAQRSEATTARGGARSFFGREMGET